ncbi:hypothetical protein F5B19DRAFT_497092 [Rostrohypoxylon terebratum]|nr:hypothetical protein F5B19DRAFT_497092 [Rostrohypoxylon terebratum]
MPGEEMEITTDFGHTGFGEDIDIDLDFAVGQPDEDLELADFDQAQEIQNFNTDMRDELMAEGDDASYGMIDADDIEHNEGAATVNDIEIDLGDPDENLWQHTALHEDTLETVAEIDYAENADVDNSTVVNVGEASWLETSTYPISNANEVEVAQTDSTALDSTSGHLPHDAAILAEGVDTQDFGLSDIRNDTKAPSDDGLNDNNPEDVAEGVTNEEQTITFDSEPQQPAEGSVPSEGDLQDNHDDVQSNGDASQGNTAHEVQELEAYQDEVPEIGHLQGEISAEHKENPSASLASSYQSVNEHLVQEDETGLEPGLGDFEQEIGGNAYAEHANDQESVHSPRQGEIKAQDVDEARSRSNNPENEDQEAADADRDNHVPPMSKIRAEHPLSIATRHEMYISYGQTDYRLFAKSEDDDPNQYFLRDMSTMELPLGEFLANLREVIADELSILDELVMHVDGLGLEFSETSSGGMLEEWTFGDILGLYDNLVKNDGVEAAPCLYMYLMVRPNCYKRLVALLDSANAGRGLSEIAVYRETTPIHDEQADHPGDHSPYASSEGEEDETRHSSKSPARGEEAEISYESDEDDHRAEGEDEEHDNDPEEHVEPKSSVAHTPAAEAHGESEELDGQAEEATEVSRLNTEENNEADVNGEVIDFSDDELDLSSLKQGNTNPPLSPLHFSTLFNHTGLVNCQCQDCFELSLDQLDISMPDAPASSGLPVAAPNTEPHYQSSPTFQWPIVSSAELSFLLEQTKSLVILTNTSLPKDQQVNASPRSHDGVNLDKPTTVATAETSASNQHTPPTNELVDVAHSEVTSATVTLNGDDNDEIDYSDDDGEENEEGQEDPPAASDAASTNLKTPIDDEITWESDDEDVKNETTTAPKTTVQVSPSSGKRRRSISDLLDDSTGQNDVKRRRPS